MDKYGNCPKCGKSWDGGSILELFKSQREAGYEHVKGMTDKELEDRMKEWYAPPYRYSNLLGIEIQGGYDGISYWQCPYCKTMWDRFTGKEHSFGENSL